MKIIKTIRELLLVILFLLLCLLIYSELWFLKTWDSGINFSTIVYQFFSPLKGTSGEVIQSYVENCIYPMLSVISMGIVVFCGGVFCRKRVVISWDISIFDKKIFLYNKKLIGHFFVICCFCILGNIAWKNAVTIGVVDYINQITRNSAIFEEEYIDPDTIDIIFPKTKKNLILIYLESMESTYASVDVGGGKPLNYIPELTTLAFDNVFFSNDADFGGGSGNGAGWTMEAILASSAGVPYKLGINGNEAGLYEEFLPGIVSLGEILQENGYHNYFMCGSDASFAGRNDFYRQHGNYTMIDLITAREEGFITEDYHNGFWGMEDEKLFEYAKIKLSDIGYLNDPFNFTLLTVDTHHPDGYVCQLCRGEYDQQYANVLACSSRQVADFVNWVQGQPWYEDTVIVLVGDHLSMTADFWDDIGDYERKIYNCFINISDNLVPAQTKNRIFTILDMYPSILTAMDAKIEGGRLGLGVDLFSDEETLPEKMGIDRFNDELGL